MANPYVKQTWIDNNVANPTSAARMGVLETGIFDAHYQPCVRVTHNAAQTLTTSVVLYLAFNTERFDTASNVADTMHDTVTNNSRLVCRYAGKYQITGTVEFASSATGERMLAIRKNGTTDIARNRVPSSVGIDNLVVTVLEDMAVNDYVELGAFQSAGANLNVNSAANYSPEFMMVKVG